MPRYRICFKKCQQNSDFLAKINLKFQRVSFASLLLFTVAFLSACGGGSGEEATAAISDSLTRSTRTANTTKLSRGNTMKVIDLPTSTNIFTIPENTLSFAFFAIGDPQSPLAFERLINPAGENVLKSGSTLQQFREENRGYRRPYGMDAIQIPIVPPAVDPTHLPNAGTWLFATSGQPTTLKLVIRTGTVPSQHRTILPIQPFLASDEGYTIYVSSILKQLKQIYKKFGIRIKYERIIQISDPKFATVSPNFNDPATAFLRPLDPKLATVSPDFNDPTTAALVSMGGTNQINLFFVEQFKGNPHKTLALTSTPGVFGFENRYNGMLIAMRSDRFPPSYTRHNEVMESENDSMNASRQDLPYFVAHGIANFLGLQATMTLDKIPDLLTDTPECFPWLSTAIIEPCSSYSNIMFPIFSIQAMPETYEEAKNQNTPLFRRPFFTPQQIYILKHSPIAY